MQTVFPLSALCSGQSGVIDSIHMMGAMFERLCDLGFTKGSVVTCLFPAILGDPCAYRIRGSVIALRKSDARHIQCRICGGEE